MGKIKSSQLSVNTPSIEDINLIRRSGFRPQVVGCFLNNKKILFLFKKEHNLWQLPQGGVDNGETLEEAMIREMNEELGSNFLENAGTDSIIGMDEIEFPSETKNSRELKTDDGKSVFMKGKKYFFVAVNAKTEHLDIKETEFDDYRWCGNIKASELTALIYQSGKRRITEKALKILLDLGKLA